MLIDVSMVSGDAQDVGTFMNSLSQLSASMGLIFQSPPIQEKVGSTRTPDIKKVMFIQVLLNLIRFKRLLAI